MSASAAPVPRSAGPVPLVQQLTAQLQADPYRMDVLIERLLLQAAHGEHAAAAADLAVLERLKLSAVLLRALRAALSGRLEVRPGADAYLLLSPGADAASRELAQRCLGEVLEDARRFFGPRPTRLIVEISAELAGLYHAAAPVPGIAHVKLSPLRSLAEYEAVIAHELAHVHFTSGNRFLDEAAAVFFQSRRDGGRIFIGAWLPESAAAPLRQPPAPLRALLAYDGRVDPYFERLLPPPLQRQLVYVAGCRLIEHLLECAGVVGLRRLGERVAASAAAAAHPACVAELLGEPVEVIERRLYPEVGVGPVAAAAGPADAAAGPDAVQPNVLWSQLTPRRLAAHIERLRASLAAHCAAPGGLQAALVRGLARRVLTGTAAAPLADLAEMRSLMHDLDAARELPRPEQLLLRSWLAIAETHAAPSLAERILSWRRALATIGAALVELPDEAELLCAAVVLHQRGPIEYGADRALARRCLERARRDGAWRAAAEAIERIFGGNDAHGS